MTLPSTNNNKGDVNSNMIKGNGGRRGGGGKGRTKSKSTTQQSQVPPSSSPEAIYSKKKIQELLNLLEIQNKSKAPGFSNVLGLSAERLEARQFYWKTKDVNNYNALTFRYTVPSRLLLSKLDCTTTLTTYLSIVDDVVSWTLILCSLSSSSSSSSSSKRYHKNKRFQYGGTTSAEWCPSAQLGLFPGAIIDITARVNPNEIDTAIVAWKEQGTSLPIVVDIELRDAETGSIICHMTQEKFLDSNNNSSSGNERSSIKNWILFGRCCRCKSNSDVLEAVCPVSLQISDMYETLDFITHTKASFIVSPKHANTGLGSSFHDKETLVVHNGCQSILLEFMGRQVAQHILACPMAYLDIIEINFVLPLKASTKIMLEAFPLTQKRRYMTMRIIITTADGGIVTEGLLQFTDTIQGLGKQQQSSMYIANNNMNNIHSPQQRQQQHEGTGHHHHHPKRLYASTPTIHAEQLANQGIPEFPPPPGGSRNDPGRHSNFTAPTVLVRPPSGVSRPTSSSTSGSIVRPAASSIAVVTNSSKNSSVTSTPRGSDGKDHPTYRNPSSSVRGNRMANTSINNNNNRHIRRGRLPDEDEYEDNGQAVQVLRPSPRFRHYEVEDDHNVNSVPPPQDTGRRRNYHHCGFDGGIDTRQRSQQQQDLQHPAVERKISNTSSVYSRTSFDTLPPPVGYHHELEDTIPRAQQQQPPPTSGRHRGGRFINQHDDRIDDDPKPGFPCLPERKIASIHSREGGLLSSTSSHSRTSSTINTADYFPTNSTTRQSSGGLGSQNYPPPRLVTAGLMSGGIVGGGGSNRNRNKQILHQQPMQHLCGGVEAIDDMAAAMGASSPAVAMGIPCSSIKESSSSSTTTSPHSPTKPNPVLGFGKSVGSGSSSGSRGYTMPQEKIPPRT